MAEVALALVLLICAGLLIQSFARLGHVPTGLRPDRLLTARIGLPGSAYPKNENIIAFYPAVAAETSRSSRAWKSASTIMPLPLSSSNMVTDFDIAEHPLPEGQRAAAPVRVIGDGLLQDDGHSGAARPRFRRSTTPSSARRS